MTSIENEFLTVEALSLGAELSRVYDKKTGKELLYDAKGNWPHHDHVLFPFIGPDSHYSIAGKPYSCSTQHGFVRSCDLKVVELSRESVTFALEENEKTRACYPFSFRLLITYALRGRSLLRRYEVINKGKEPLPCMVGDHAAYRVVFGKAILHLGDKVTYLPRPDFVLQEPQPFEHPGDYLLSKEDFRKYETIVIENPGQDLVLDTGDGLSLTYHFPSPYLAIWSDLVESDGFVCVEPWWGLPPYQGMPEELKDRKACQSVIGQSVFEESIAFSETAVK